MTSNGQYDPASEPPEDQLTRADGTLDPEAVRAYLAAGAAAGEQRKLAAEAAHAARHGRTELRYGRVERRPGFKGAYTCLDCYYGGPR